MREKDFNFTGRLLSAPYPLEPPIKKDDDTEGVLSLEPLVCMTNIGAEGAFAPVRG
jgi:hypothetical protein